MIISHAAAAGIKLAPFQLGADNVSITEQTVSVPRPPSGYFGEVFKLEGRWAVWRLVIASNYSRPNRVRFSVDGNVLADRVGDQHYRPWIYGENSASGVLLSTPLIVESSLVLEVGSDVNVSAQNIDIQFIAKEIL